METAHLVRWILLDQGTRSFGLHNEAQTQDVRALKRNPYVRCETIRVTCEARRSVKRGGDTRAQIFVDDKLGREDFGAAVDAWIDRRAVTDSTKGGYG
jgi:hypothetical protein